MTQLVLAGVLGSPLGEEETHLAPTTHADVSKKGHKLPHSFHTFMV